MNESILLSSNVLAAVLIVMMALVVVMQLISKLGEQQAHRSRESTEENRPSAELIAVLTAAATEALGKPVSLHRVHLHREAAHPRWARAGRMDIMFSHRVEPRR